MTLRDIMVALESLSVTAKVLILLGCALLFYLGRRNVEWWLVIGGAALAFLVLWIGSMGIIAILELN